MATASYTVKIDWNDDGDFSDTGEDVTSRVLGDDSISFHVGRDTARALSAIAPSDTSFELNNRSADYSPDNPSSPLSGLLGPGKRVQIQATSGTTRDLFRGFIDDYELLPAQDKKAVALGVLDLLSKFGQAVPSTRVFPSLQTGGAIHELLNAMNWPSADRDIDSGATTLRWWFTDGTDGLSALGQILEAEGPPSMAYVDGSGTFVFRDRHHRLVRSAGTAVQATFRSSGTEPAFSAPMVYDIGWKDLINQVDVDIEEKDPGPLGAVWTAEETISLSAGETKEIVINGDDAFINALAPVETTDYILVSGTVQMTISDTSGQTIKLTIYAPTAAIVEALQVRAQPLEVTRTIRVTGSDQESQTKHGLRTLQDAELKLANRNDAEAIAQILVGQRAERLPIVSISVNNGHATRLTNILDRKLSDRVHIIEPDQTFVDDDYFIERIDHEIAASGTSHIATFHCERAPAIAGATPNYFTFDTAGSGFNQGVFAQSGVSFTSEVLILDDATKGQLNNRGLGF